MQHGLGLEDDLTMVALQKSIVFSRVNTGFSFAML